MSRPAPHALALAFIFALVAPSGPAAADAILARVGDAGELSETGHDLSIRLSGSIAVVESTQTIVNRGKRATEALYTFELPGEAVITDVSIRLADGRVATATPVDAGAAIRFGSDEQVVDAEPDIGLLRLVERVEADPFSGAPAIATYELRVWPVEAGRAVIVTTSWLAPLRYDDGRLSLRVPGRNPGGALVQEDVTVDVTPPAGTRGVRAVHGGGRALQAAGKRTRQRYRFTAPADGDLVVEYTPIIGERPPHALVSYATAPLDKRSGVVALSVLVPPPAPNGLPQYERVILVVDVSRSMSRAGIGAARDMVDAVLDAAGASAEIEVVLYDRTARRLFGQLSPNQRDERELLARALENAPLDNGSDLGSALDEVRAIFSALPDDHDKPPRDGATRGLGPTDLIAIVSDGMSPLELTDDRAADRIGERALAEAEVLAITIVPDDAPVPDTTAGPLAALARKTGGRSIAVWASGAERRAAQLAAELARPPALELPAVEAGRGTTVDGFLLPAKLDPGRGAFAIGSYSGRAPAKLRLTGTVKGQQVDVTATRDRKDLERAALPLWQAETDVEDLVPEDERISGQAREAMRYDAATLARATKALLAIAARAPAVTRYSALIATDPRDQFSKERFAFADKWGPSLFFRVPAPPERADDHEFRPLSIVTAPTGGANPAWRPTGDLDFDIVARLMRSFVLPKAQACYQRALREQPKLAGTLTVIVEIARGEVQDARIAHSTLTGNAVDSCVLDAAYSIRVPRVALGDDTEYIGVARYPIRFRRVGNKADVSRGKAPPADGNTADDPLGGLPEEKR